MVIMLHAGILGNELTDSLVRKGSVTQFIGLKSTIDISKDCIRITAFRILREQQYQEWLAQVDRDK